MDIYEIIKSQYTGKIGDKLFEIINPLTENHVATFAYIGDDFILSLSDVERKIKIKNYQDWVDVEAKLKDIRCKIDISLNVDDLANDVALYTLKFYDKENNVIKVIVSGGYVFPNSVFVIEGNVLANYLAFYSDGDSEFIIEDFLDINQDYAKCEEHLEGGNLQYLSELIKKVLDNEVVRIRKNN